MKTKIARAAVLSLTLGVLFNAALYAQYSPSSTNSTPSSSTTKATPPKTTTSSTPAAKQEQPKNAGAPSTHKMLTKNEWQKRYNDIKPKVEALANKAKSETNADITVAAAKMNKLAEDFGDKVDKIDNITADKREAFENDLRAANKALNEQYEKTKAMWNKMHPAAKKEAPANQAPK